MTTTFETAKIGDKVWCSKLGWGEIRNTSRSESYPLYVRFQSGNYEAYTLDGFFDKDDVSRSLFWDEVKFEAPKKPLPNLEVDAKVIVWNSTTIRLNRHFSHFSPLGNIVCFVNGMSSWTSEHTSEWDNWELVE